MSASLVFLGCTWQPQNRKILIRIDLWLGLYDVEDVRNRNLVVQFGSSISEPWLIRLDASLDLYCVD